MDTNGQLHIGYAYVADKQRDGAFLSEPSDRIADPEHQPVRLRWPIEQAISQ